MNDVKNMFHYSEQAAFKEFSFELILMKSQLDNDTYYFL